LLGVTRLILIADYNAKAKRTNFEVNNWTFNRFRECVRGSSYITYVIRRARSEENKFKDRKREGKKITPNFRIDFGLPDVFRLYGFISAIALFFSSICLARAANVKKDVHAYTNKGQKSTCTCTHQCLS
jgi:hypothetical protein